MAVDAQTIVGRLQAALRFVDRCQSLRVDVRQSLIDFTVTCALGRIITVLRQRVAGKVDSRLTLTVQRYLTLKYLLTGVQGMRQGGTLVGVE